MSSNARARSEIESSDLRLRVGSRGEVESILHAGSSYEFIAGLGGYSAVQDCLTCSLCGHSHTECVEIHADEDLNGLAVSRRFPESGIRIVDTFSAKGEAVSWKTKVSIDSDTPRTANIFMVLPVLGKDRHVFVPHNDAPFAPDDFRHLSFVYGGDMFRRELERALALPLVAFYRPADDVGLTCAAPAGMMVPAMWYSMFHESDAASFVINYTNFRLDQDHSPEVELLLAGHGGNWQEGLAWYHNRYRDYFTVKSESVYDTEGPMLCSSTLHGRDQIAKWSDQGLKWQELHANMFPKYGLYSPNDEQWETYRSRYAARRLDLPMLAVLNPMSEYDTLTQYPHEPPMSKDCVRDYIDSLHANGMAGFVYFNPVNCDKQLSTQFGSSVSKQEDGTCSGNGYYFGVSMNPDQANDWGRHIMRQLEGVLKDYPNCDGIFLDELHYRHYDFAHDDAITMVHNKPCAMLGFAMAQLAERICDLVHAAGKAVWSNAPTSLEVIKHVDGYMAEDCDWWAGTIKYFGIEKPMVLLATCQTVESLRKTLKSCLLIGAQPHVPWAIDVDRLLPGDNKETRICMPHGDEDKIEVHRRFLPLLDLIKGRTWVLAPDALRHPSSVKGNCFERRDGSLVVTIVADTPTENATIRISDAILSGRTKAEVVTTENGTPEALPCWSEDGWTSLKIPSLRHAAVVRFA